MTDVHKLNLRLPMHLIEEAKAEAEALHVSLNTYILQAIANYIPYTRRITKSWPPTAAPSPASRRQRQRHRRRSATPRRLLRQRRAPSEAAVPKVGRNQPCPCGSGKRYRHCHGDGLSRAGGGA